MFDDPSFQEWVKGLRETIEYYSKIQPPESSSKTNATISSTSQPPQEPQSQNTAQSSVFCNSILFVKAS
jgi:hypothetical protein